MTITGKDGKVYNTVDECVAADKAFDEAQEKRALVETEKKNALSKQKKELADAITAADDQVTAALDKYEQAQTEARKIMAEARDRAQALLKVAKDEYDAAADEHWKAVKAFNDRFGTYTAVYTGNKAMQEYNRMARRMDDYIERVFNRFFW